jgi:hypothetical protein
MLFFRLLGLTLIDDNLNEIKSLRAINLIWMVGNVGIFIFLAQSIFTRNYTHMADVIEIANYVFVLVTHQIILLHIQFVTKKEILWYSKLRQVEELLCREYDIKISHDFIKRTSVTKAMIIFTITSICATINVYYVLRSKDFILLLSAHNYILKVIINLRYIQNALRVDFMKYHLLAFQNAIENVVERNHVEWKIVFVLDKLNRRHNPIKKIDDINDIVKFKHIHAILYESTKLLENCFGWSLLAMISFTFIDLTSNLYWFFLAFLNLDEKFYTFDCVVEIIPSILALMCVIYSSYDVSRKAKDGVNIIIKLYTNTTSDYNVMVKEFLMQLHHERIENSANDFFLVDCKLFSAVSVCAYVFNFIFAVLCACLRIM